MTLENLLDILKFAAEINGYRDEITINDFNNYLWLVDIKHRINLYEGMFDGGYETNQNNTDNIRLIKESVAVPLTVGVGSLPSDYFRVSSVLYGDIEVKFISDKDYAKRKDNEITKPSLTNPVYKISGSDIYVYPTSIASVTLDYLKQSTAATKPELVFKAENGIQVYDSASSTELVWGDDSYPEILRLLLEELGITVNNIQTASYLEQIKTREQ